MKAFNIQSQFLQLNMVMWSQLLLQAQKLLVYWNLKKKDFVAIWRILPISGHS